MDKKRNTWLALTALLVVVLLACKAFGGAETEPLPKEPDLPPTATEIEPAETTAQPSVSPPAAQDEPEVYDTDFPLPEDVQNFTKIFQKDQGINFQTSMSLEEVIAFYRQAFTEQGLVERPALTVIEDVAFSMVFEGAANGKAVVIQGVLLGPDQTNVNIRYEDL